MPRRYPIAVVEWEDASGGNNQWCEPEDVMPNPYMVRTAGHLLRRNRREVVVVANHARTGEVGDAMRIPRGMVRSIEVLKR